MIFDTSLRFYAMNIIIFDTKGAFFISTGQLLPKIHIFMCEINGVKSLFVEFCIYTVVPN